MGYGSEPLGTGGAPASTSSDDDADSSDATSTEDSATVVTVTLGSSNTSSTSDSGDSESSSTETSTVSSTTGGGGTSSTASATSGGDGGATATSSGGMASTTTAESTTVSTTGGMGFGGAGAITTGGASTTGEATPTTFRYARLVALTSQNGNPYAAIAELQLLDGNAQPINSSGWTASADSEETVDETAPASQAIDGDPATFWHTEWGDYEAPLPHYLQIDLGSAQEITGFIYTPRPGQDNGWILAWEFYLSNSATSPGTPVDSGSFASGETVQTVNLP